MQINLSTTTERADGLSPIFSENVGADDTVVFGPASWFFPANAGGFFQPSRPFRYNPLLGNLLMDVRILDGSGPPDARNNNAALLAYNSSTDEVSTVWATNVSAAVASEADTTGLWAIIGFKPNPLLKGRV